MTGPLRVLIVEDEPIIAMTAEDMLAELGCESRICATLEQALAAAADGEFDLALLDVNLNGVESFPVAERLRERGVPFFFATGYGSAACPEHLGSVPVVTKPYRLDDLQEAMAAVR